MSQEVSDNTNYLHWNMTVQYLWSPQSTLNYILVNVMCITYFRRPWIKELLHSASWSTLALRFLWLLVWRGTQSRTYCRSSPQNTTCNWPERRTVRNYRMSRARVSTWRSMPSSRCHIHVCTTYPLPCSELIHFVLRYRMCTVGKVQLAALTFTQLCSQCYVPLQYGSMLHWYHHWCSL